MPRWQAWARKKTIKEDGQEQTVPNIEVRIGAILALERMAKKNADVHIQIMEMLTAYIRENAPRTQEKHDRKPRQDIQFAFTVIGRRPPRRIALERMQGFRLDLRNCNLAQIDGNGLDFSYGNLLGCKFRNGWFLYANLQHAEISHADLEYTQLNRAKLQHATLWTTKMQYACLTDANMYDADLRHVELIDATLKQANLRKAKLQGADLRRASLQHTKNLRDAALRGASFSAVDFTHVSISQKQINEIFFAGVDNLLDHLTRPDHWPKEELNDYEHDKKWRAWQKTLPPIDA